MSRWFRCAAAVCAFVGLGAMSVPIPKLMNGVPAGKGKWQVQLKGLPDVPELRSAPPELRKMLEARMQQPLTVCAEDYTKLGTEKADRNDCKATLLEDKPDTALMRMTCARPEPIEVTSRYTRIGPNRFSVDSTMKSASRTMTSTAELRYLGAC